MVAHARALNREYSRCHFQVNRSVQLRGIPTGALYRRLKYQLIVPDAVPRMEMFGMPHEDVMALLQSTGVTILDVRPDDGHETDAAAFEYWVTK